MNHNIVVLSTNRQTRRQIARALGSGGVTVDFQETVPELQARLQRSGSDLVILDNDGLDPGSVEQSLRFLNDMASTSPMSSPLVLLSTSDKAALLHLIKDHDIRNLVAKHGAIRAAYNILDERELLVTCEKVIRRDIFGIEKYVNNWGVLLHHARVTGLADKANVLSRFERYLQQLDCLPSVISDIVNVADELILNAVVHAPVGKDGEPRYEKRGPVPDLELEPNEYVDVNYGCDGQRLMLSVSDKFGRLNKKTLLNYMSRGMEAEKLVPEDKASGAGLGLVMSFRSIHQLIFNIHDTVRTEVIAGWYLRIQTAADFREVGKSLNLFWLPSELKLTIAHYSGRIDETTNFGRERTFHMGRVSGISSRGIVRWRQFVDSLEEPLELLAVTEPLVRAATEVDGMLNNVSVKSVVLQFECQGCSVEQSVEQPVEQGLVLDGRTCASCNDRLVFTGIPEQFETFFQLVRP